jgi:hypothetical protein
MGHRSKNPNQGNQAMKLLPNISITAVIPAESVSLTDY